MNARALITGASGFIGSHLAAHLETENWRVARLERSATGARDHYFADIRDFAALQRVFSDVRPETVFHLAGTRTLDAALSLQINAVGTAHVLEAARACGAKRVVMAASAAEYGAPRAPWHEELPLCPRSAYGISRAAATQTALCAAQNGEMRVVVLRLGTVYGPRQPQSMFVAGALDALQRGEAIAPRDPSHRQDLVFVGDVVEAFFQGATRDISSQVINIGGGAAPTLGEVAALMEALWHGNELPLRAATPTNAPMLSLNRAQALLNWTPRTGLEAGLRATVEAVRLR